MPRVPDEGLGCVIGQGCWGWVGDASKQPSTMQETAILGCMLTVGQDWGWFGAGKKHN
jgi:hypothetical protein